MLGSQNTTVTILLLRHLTPQKNAQDYFAEENVKIKSITIQELRPYEISVDAERVLEVVWEEAEANVGDLVDDWLDSRTAYTTEQLADLSKRLTGVIKTWLEETHNEPDFFNIIGEKEISICNIPQQGDKSW